MVVSFVLSTNQKPFVIICTRVTGFALVLQVCNRITEEMHSFLSQSELSNFVLYIILSLTAVHSKRNGGWGAIKLFIFAVIIGQV